MNLDPLQTQLQLTLESFESAQNLLQLSNEILTNGNITSSNDVRLLQKKLIIQSSSINSLNKSNKSNYKQFLDNEFEKLNSQYKQEVSKTEQINFMNEKRHRELEALETKIEFPSFIFNVDTLREFEAGKYYTLFKIEERNQQNFKFNELFNLDNFPSAQEFERLLELEKKTRIKKFFKFELLSFIKTSYQSKSTRWSARDTKLKNFIDRDLRGMISSVKSIKRHDEDLRYGQESGDDEDEEEDDDKEEDKPVEQEKEETKEEVVNGDPSHDDGNVQIQTDNNEDVELDKEEVLETKENTAELGVEDEDDKMDIE